MPRIFIWKFEHPTRDFTKAYQQEPHPVKLFRRVMQHFRHFSPVLGHYRRHLLYRRIL